MPFFPDSAWGLAYLAGLLLSVVATWAWPSPEGRRVALLMVLHWMTLRAIDVTAPQSPLAWVCHDMALILLLALWGRCRLAYAVAAVFLPVTLLDQVWLVWGSTFEANAAAAEAAGYLAFIMMMGAAYGGTGTGFRRMGRSPHPVRAVSGHRSRHSVSALEGGRPISGRAALPRPRLDRPHGPQKAGGRG